MKKSKGFWRGLFFALLMIILCGGLLLPAAEISARAAPPMQASVASVVISEFRFVGPQGADDEFIELYNPRNVPVDISNYRIMGSNGSGTTNRRVTLGNNVVLQPGQYYLLVNAGASQELLALQNATYSSGITEDGGIAVTLPDQTTVIDAVGLNTGSAYKEGTPLNPLSGSSNQSYERKTGGNAGNCDDTNDNAADFVWNQTSSNPQNSSSPRLVCLVVTNVSSTAPDGIYSAGATIDITVTFNQVVDVIGVPTLLLETGTTDRMAVYVSGSDSNTLSFRYMVAAEDSSGDLDYVATNSLSLNGGTIRGAVGDAVLSLPTPGSPGSLGANKNLVIDNGIAPSLLAFSRQSPAALITNANDLTFRVTFSEAVRNVDNADFIADGTTANVTSVRPVNSSTYDVTISGGNLSNLNADAVGLDLGATQNIVDGAGNPLPLAEPPVDETFTLDNIAPTVTINQALTQSDPADVIPVTFSVAFSEPIDVGTFSPSDITQTGIDPVTWSITDSGDHQNFTLAAIAVSSNGNLSPSIPANRVKDRAGNDNTPSVSADNTVVFNDTTRPSVTINQAATQVDPTASVPIVFTVVFSEAIDARVFTPSDVTQTGTATGITWTITDSGDHRVFSLSATEVTGRGTLIPSIPANRVTDFVGNNNTPSTSTDNVVTYSVLTPTPTAGPTATIVISEFRTIGPSGASDEFIELFNRSSSTVSLGNWIVKKSSGCGATITTVATIPATVSLRPGQHYLIRGSGYSDAVAADLSTTLDLANEGGIALFQSDGATIVDQVGLCSSTTFREGIALFQLTTNANRGYDRKAGAAGVCGDTNNNFNDFFLRTPSDPQNSSSTLTLCGNPTPAPSSTPRPVPSSTPTPLPPPPLIAINEFVPRPGHDWNLDGVINVGDEYIELINHGVIDVNLSGYALDDEVNIGSDPFHLPDIIMRPGDRKVFYGSETGLLLSDGGDGVRLLKPNGQLMDAYNYFVVRSPDQSYCRLPDNGGADDWNQNCFPTPGLQNSLSGGAVNPPSTGDAQILCPIADTLPADFVLAECLPLGQNIWNAAYWDLFGWYDEKYLPESPGKWTVFVD